MAADTRTCSGRRCGNMCVCVYVCLHAAHATTVPFKACRTLAMLGLNWAHALSAATPWSVWKASVPEAATATHLFWTSARLRRALPESDFIWSAGGNLGSSSSGGRGADATAGAAQTRTRTHMETRWPARPPPTLRALWHSLRQRPHCCDRVDLDVEKRV